MMTCSNDPIISHALLPSEAVILMLNANKHTLPPLSFFFDLLMLVRGCLVYLITR